MDIEIKLGDALRTAFGQFETRLKNLKSKMAEETSTFAEQAVTEAQIFARAIKVHGMDSHEALKNHFELITDDKQAEEETELKMVEIGETLFKFLLYEDTEDVKAILDGVEEHVTSNIGSRETKIARHLNDDYSKVSEGIQQAQHHRNREVIREIVESC